MIRINLLPYWEKGKKENLRKQLIVFSTSLVVFVIILVSLYIHAAWSVYRLDAEVYSLAQRKAVLDKQVGDVEANIRKKKELEQKLAIIDKLDRDRFFVVRLLRETSVITPAGNVWLNRVTQREKEVRFDGFARNNAVVAQFMENAEKSGFLTDIELVVSRQEEVDKVPLQRFVVTGRLSKN